MATIGKSAAMKKAVASKKKTVTSPKLARSMNQHKKLVVADPSTCGLNTAMVADYEKAMKELVQKKIMPGCASIVFRKGQVVQAGCWGKADCETGAPMTMDTLCRLVCMTKPYVAVAFGTMVDEGLADFEDRLDKHLPEFKDMTVLIEDGKKTVKASGPIRLKHLLSHTSGIEYPVDLGESADTPQMKRYLKLQTDVRDGNIRTIAAFAKKLATFPLGCHPGANYNYGYSFDVMARVLEVIAGKSLDKVLYERVFEPLGMHDTLWSVPESKLDRLAACYSKIGSFKHMYPGKKPKGPGGDLVRIDGHKAKDSAWAEGNSCPVLSGGGFMGYLAGGGPVSTVNDTVPFIRMLLNHGVMESGQRLLQGKTLATLEKNRNKKSWGQGEACYLCNIGAFREGGSELGMGGAACTYWSVDRKEDIATIWFTQHIDMPDPSNDGPELMGGVDPARVDLWKTLHNAAMKGGGKGAKRSCDKSEGKRPTKAQKTGA